jgi:hypothetical protein
MFNVSFFFFKIWKYLQDTSQNSHFLDDFRRDFRKFSRKFLSNATAAAASCVTAPPPPRPGRPTRALESVSRRGTVRAQI